VWPWTLRGDGALQWSGPQGPKQIKPMQNSRFLRAQINPHFLFNTLNNIYSMAVTKNENTAATIMKLSNIMRYVTDDVYEDYVSLQSEVDCITDYIDLQKLRLGKKGNWNIPSAVTLR
jgi:sensor histidine kinase YesM